MQYHKNHNLRKFLILISVLSLLGACSSGGGGSGGTPPSPQTTVSGKVVAPNGEVAKEASPSVFANLLQFVFPVARAEVSGLLPVADNTPVELNRIFDSGNIDSTLTTTTVTAGNYSINLDALNIGFSSDLIVSVSGIGGAQLRAFVTQSKVDIGPVSEAAVRLVLEQIALTSGASLANFTSSEINDLVGSIDLLSSLHQVQAGADIETTVSALIALVKQSTYIMNFLSAAVASGQTPEGTGDIGNLVPLEQGDLWHRLAEDNGTPLPYLVAEEVAGTKLIGSTLTTVIQSHNFDNTGTTVEEYLTKDSNGIVNWGNNDPDDVVSPTLVPYQQLTFPLTLGTTQTVMARTGLVYPEDFDLDGQNETFDVTATVTPIGTEQVTVQLGSFPQALRLDTHIDITVRLSASSTAVNITEQVSQWLLSGVGVLKQELSVLSGNTTDTSTSQLLGYLVGGNGEGVLPAITTLPSIATANSDTTRPGRSGVASDGSSYLVVACREAGLGSPSGLIGTFVTDHKTVSSEFAIANHDCQFPWPAVAYNGTNYLVTFGRGGAIYGITVSTTGVVGSEFLISPDSISNFSPRIATDGNNYLVVWQRYVTNDYDIYGALVSPTNNVTPLTLFSAAGEQVYPDIAYNGSNYLVAWRDTPDGSGPSLSSNISGTRVTPTGNVLDPSGIDIVSANDYQGEPQVASDGLNYFVAWLDTPTLGSDPVLGASFYGKLIDSSGTLINSQASDKGTLINASPYGKGESALTFDGTNYLLAWRVGAYNTSPPAGIYGARITPAGVLLDGPTDSAGLVLTGMPPDATKYVYPSLSSSGNHTLMLWSNNREVQGQLKSVEAAMIYPWQ